MNEKVFILQIIFCSIFVKLCRLIILLVSKLTFPVLKFNNLWVFKSIKSLQNLQIIIKQETGIELD